MNSVNSKTEDLSSNCTMCGESFLTNGNYSFKVLPSKRIPKKAIRFRKNLMSVSSNSSSSSTFETMWGLTKFQKYLLKRSTPKNFCELKCKNCNTICKIPLTKSIKRYTTTSNSQTKTPNSCHSNSGSFLGSGGDEGKRKRKKKKKEVNAGLIIPESFRPSSATLSAQNVTNNNNNNKLTRTKSQSASTPLNPTAFRNLQKALFKSNTTDLSGATSGSSNLSKLLQ